MVEVVLGLGSNLGDREDNLRRALTALASHVALTAQSPVYETLPMYVSEQPAFLNMAVRGETELSADALLAELKAVEKALGRGAGPRFGPRLIDLGAPWPTSRRTGRTR
jgi:2-amino-4-hydroxy-6-hydroxymethyldihydropteridine diphosphokinase